MPKILVSVYTIITRGQEEQLSKYFNYQELTIFTLPLRNPNFWRAGTHAEDRPGRLVALAVIWDGQSRLAAQSVCPSAGAIMADTASQVLLGSGLTILSQPLMYVKVLIQVGFEPLPPTIGGNIFGWQLCQLPGLLLCSAHCKHS
jgi:hypothetical protein